MTEAKIYVCSPYRPVSETEASRKQELQTNVNRAKQACQMLVTLGYFPLAPHLYFTRFLDDDDPSQREEGMRMAMEWLDEAEELWVFGNVISEGMAAEIARAKELGKPVRNMPEPGKIIRMILEEMKEKHRED